MTSSALLLRDGWLQFRHGPDPLGAPRPFTADDRDLLRALAERYAVALGRTVPERHALAVGQRATHVAQADLEAIGRALYTWLDGAERWLERALSAGVSPPWLVAITVPGETADAPDEHAFLEAPWELIRNDGGALAARTKILWNPVRRLGEARAPRPPSLSELSVLFMAAAPLDVSALSYEEEETAILDGTRRMPIDLIVEESGTLTRLVERMAEEETPVDILQLSCHGSATPAPRLLLEDERGHRAEIDPDTFARALGANLPKSLLFLSACETADPYGVIGTFAAQMIARGVPAALGWGGSVRDAEAIRFAAALYQRLSRKEPLESAVAYARADLLAERAPGERAPEAFHLARLYLAPDGGGPLTQGTRKRARRPDVDRAFLNAKDKVVPVATQAEFVGRRRQLQAVLREIAEPTGAGVLLHGMGHHGKSSLAARVAQRSRRVPVVIFERYDAASVLAAIDHQTSKSAIHALAEGWRSAVEARPAELRVALRELLEGPCRDETPILLVIDDAERLLDGSRQGLHLVKPRYVETLQAILEAFDGADTRSRLLLTSRFTFTLPHGGRDLAERLVTVHVPPMSELEGRKQARARDRASGTVGAIEKERGLRCIRGARGNPGLQSLLFKSAAAAPEACDRALDALERHHQDGTAPEDEDLRRFLEGLAIGELLGLLSAEEERLLRDTCVFSSVPVPAKVLGGGARLLALGLWDQHEDPRGGEEVAVLVNPLVRPRLGVLGEQEAEAAAGRWVQPLFLAWGRENAERAWELNVELGRLAVLGGDGRVAARYAGWWVWMLHEKGAYRDAAAGGRRALRVAEEHAASPSLSLLRNVGRACVRAGVPEEAASLYARALDQVKTAEQAGEAIDAGEHAELLRALGDLLARRGKFDDALTHYEEAKALFSGQRFDLHRALVMGQIAHILHARGQLDEALRILHEEALPVFEALGDTRSRAHTMGKIADILHTRGTRDEALRILREEVLPVFETHGDIRERAVTMGRIADIVHVRGQFDEALRIRREEELPVFETLGDIGERAVTIGKIADILHDQGRLDEALQILREEVLPEFETRGERREMLVIRMNIAMILLQRGAMGDRDEASALISLALQAAQEMKLPEAATIEQLQRRHGL